MWKLGLLKPQYTRELISLRMNLFKTFSDELVKRFAITVVVLSRRPEIVESCSVRTTNAKLIRKKAVN